MSSDTAPTAAQQRARDLPLEQPPPLSKMLEDDRRQVDDCTPCRVMGASAFIGLGIYSYLSGHSQLRQERARILASKSLLGLRARKASITGLAATLVGLGVYRLVN
ncbi:hypothetical protein GTA08_BOTSDO04904 [Botryosphaeria dothidea]|uniref:Distal membrane-arm assembly complex protein 1-like domain-containing protein n=1 Tax=Botryosphaeria dothidea TaxID=55169 RepID=A0A8H4N2R6_9PEZI|nr:hypothetical protein GTA08_BOTSDO04904 [Botryosphaeria dothidea]